jgi:hypothetical protein
MNDRLAELQGDIPSWAQENDAVSPKNNVAGGGDIEMGTRKSNKGKRKAAAAEPVMSQSVP